MIRSFKNEATQDIYHGKSSKTTRRTLPETLLKIARRKLDQLDIRINEKYRVCFEWSEQGPVNIEITDYH
jgi:toxin HigB-1